MQKKVTPLYFHLNSFLIPALHHHQQEVLLL
nr:MAG TPA: hypothetical protein [Caudoviricetes sp.]